MLIVSITTCGISKTWTPQKGDEGLSEEGQEGHDGFLGSSIFREVGPSIHDLVDVAVMW